MLKIFIFIFTLLLIPSFSYSHSGNTNSEGCHNDNINGGYHCHNRKNSESNWFENDEQIGFFGKLFSIYLPIVFLIWAIIYFIFGRNDR